MKSVVELLRQFKAVFSSLRPSVIQQIYREFMEEKEKIGLMMLHRDDIYAAGAPIYTTSSYMVDFIETHAGKKILDIGCAYGNYCKKLQKKNFECIGIDANLDYCSKAHKGIPVCAMEAENLGFGNKSVDTIIMSEVLEHIRNPYKALEEVVRVARKNYILSVPNLDPIVECVKYNVVMHHFLEPTHVNFFTQAMLERFLKQYFPYVAIFQYGQFFNLSGKRLYYHLAALASFEPIGKK